MKKFLVICLLATVTLAYADNSKLSPDLQNSSVKHAVFVVQYNQAAGPLDLANITNLLGTILSQVPLVNGVVADLPLTNILALSNQSNVKYISLNRPTTPTLSNAAPAVNAFAAWQSGYTGAGVGIALVDSGVSEHPDLHGGLLGLSRVV
jgi:serine protease AprX